MIINDLIREYMEYNHYDYSLSVFGPEAGMPKELLGREFISKKLKIVEDQNSKQLPLLYGSKASYSRHHFRNQKGSEPSGSG